MRPESVDVGRCAGAVAIGRIGAGMEDGVFVAAGSLARADKIPDRQIP